MPRKTQTGTKATGTKARSTTTRRTSTKKPAPTSTSVVKMTKDAAEMPTSTSTSEAVLPPDFSLGDNQVVDLSNKNDDELVRQTLRDIMQDPQAPAAARAQAARTMAEMGGMLGRHAPPPKDNGKPVDEMSREDLLKALSGD